jgi:hypothetical protein
MDRQCHHHPDRQAAGTCCYCDRPLCDECLFTNRQGKSFCRREDECLAYQDSLSSPGEPASPVIECLVDEFTLDAQVRRLSEVLEELGELKRLIEHADRTLPTDDGSPKDSAEPVHPLEADPRIPGFCAYELAEEAAALLGLIAFRIEVIRKEQELSESPLLLEKTNEVQGFLEGEAEHRVREYREWVEPFTSANPLDLLASLGRQGQQEDP